MKSLVVYFSRPGKNYTANGIKNLNVGNTKVVAEKIAKMINADMFEIVPKVKYSEEYYACTDQAKYEKNKNLRPEIVGSIDLSDYDTIYLGYPNWWGTMPMPVYTFLESADLSGKTIYPFCTHEGSGIGSSESDIKSICKSAKVEKGLAIQGTFVSSSDERLKNWLKLN